MSPSSWCWICVIIQQDWINANWLDCVDALAKLIPIQRHLAERLSELGMLHPTTLVDGWLTGSVKSIVIWFLQGIFSIDLFSKALELSQEARAENPCKEVLTSKYRARGARDHDLFFFMPNSWSKIHSRWKHRIVWERSQQTREVSGYSYREKDQNCHPESLKEKGKRNDIYSNLKFQLSPDCLNMSISLFWGEFCSVSVSTFGTDNNQDLQSKIFRA